METHAMSSNGDGRTWEKRCGWERPARSRGIRISLAPIALSPLPVQIVAIPVGMAYRFWLGAALIWTGWMVAAVLQYGLSRRTADDIDLSSLLERTPRWMRRFPAGHPLFLIVARQLPIGPYIVNVSAGVLHVPLWRHVWCAAIAVVPEAVLIAGISVGLFRQG
jgi:uncharacterized membrane protein YdjX (TVP38/TMEM64 family)